VGFTGYCCCRESGFLYERDVCVIIVVLSFVFILLIVFILL